MRTANRSLPVFVRRITGVLHADRRDAELLAAFSKSQDADAFAALIARHGPLVWAVCRRILRDTNDAEDAFQATFLVLAREAGQLNCRDTLTGWLYLVARRVASNLRRSHMRRQEYERRAAARRPDAKEQPDTDLGELLDRELARLPERLRKPLLLCYLQGKTHAEAAQELKCPVSTLSERLARGCEILRRRLARRGLALAGSHVALALAMAWPLNAAPPRMDQKIIEAAEPFAAGLPLSTAAAKLAREVTQATIRARLKLGMLVLTAVLGVAGAGTGAVTAAQQDTPSGKAEPPADSRPAADSKEVTRVDRFGDPLPEGAMSRVGTLRLRPGRWSTEAGVAISRDDRTVFSIDGTNEVLVWDLASGRQVRALQGPEHVVTVSLSPDGSRLVAAGWHEVWAWDVTPDGFRLRWKQKPGKIRFYCVGFSPDGRTLACGGAAEEGVVLLDSATGKASGKLPALGHKLCFSPDGRTLATWDPHPNQNSRHLISLWDVATGARRYVLTCGAGEGDQVYSFSFSPDGKALATAAADRSIRVWDVATGQERRLADDAAPEAFVAFSPDGRELIEAGAERIRFRDPATGRESRPAVTAPFLIASTDTGSACRLSADGKLIVSATSTAVGAWEVRTGRQVGPSDVPGSSVDTLAFSHDGSRLVLSTRAGRQCVTQLYDARSGRFQGEFRPLVDTDSALLVCQVGLTPAQQVVASGARFTLKNKVGDFTVSGVCFTGRAGERPTAELRMPMPDGNCIPLLSPDGRFVIASHENGDLAVHERDTGRVLRTIKGGSRKISLTFSPDGGAVAGFDSTGQVTVWGVATGKQIGSCAVDQKAMYPISVSPGGRFVAVASPGGPLQLWDATADKLVWQAAEGVGHPHSMVLSRDGRMLATGGDDGAIRVWETYTGQERLRRKGHRARVTSLAFSPDGSCLASGSSDSTALVWDLRSVGPPLRVTEPDALWSVFTGSDATAAYRAMAQLAETPERAVPLIRDRIRPRQPDVDKVRQWIRDLGNPQFRVREEASKELAELGSEIQPTLEKAFRSEESSEARARLRALLSRLGPLSTNRLAAVRGVELLERMAANPEARKLLNELARTPADSLIGQEAREARRRLDGKEPSVGKP